MTPSEALCIAETIELQVEHGYKANSREQALLTLAKKVRECNAEKGG
jgi:hypothetical protein